MFGLELLDLLSQAQDDVSGARGRSALGDERDGGKHGDDRHRHNRGEGSAAGPALAQPRGGPATAPDRFVIEVPVQTSATPMSELESWRVEKLERRCSYSTLQLSNSPTCRFVLGQGAGHRLPEVLVRCIGEGSGCV